MGPIFQIMCFTEGSPARIRSPFLNSSNSAVSYNTAGMQLRLSIPAKAKLNGRSLSDVIKPPEEVFICLVVAKFLLAKLISEGKANADEFKVGSPLALPVTPYKAKSNDAYEQNDINFFYRHVKTVLSLYKEDLEKAVDKRWIYFDFAADFDDGEQEQAVDGDAESLDAESPASNVNLVPFFEI